MFVHVQAFLFIFLYGLASVVGLSLSVFWSRLARRRRLMLDYPWWHDRYYLVAAGFALVSGGQAIVDIARTVGNIQYGLSPILLHTEGWFVFFGMVVLLIGLGMMVWIADLETHPPQWTWLKRAGIFTVVWAVFAFIVHIYVPLTPGV